MTVEDVMEKILEDLVFYDESGGGVTFSGGEPLMQPEYLYDLLSACKTAGIHTSIDTCGYAEKEVVLRIAGLTDLFLLDLKLLDDALHREYTGVSNQCILDNLKILCEHHKQVILRFPVIPGITDTETNIRNLKKLMKDYSGQIHEIDLLPWHSLAKGKYSRLQKSNPMEHIPDLEPESLESLKQELGVTGYSVKIGG